MSKMDDMRAMREARFGQASPRPTESKAAPAEPKRVKASRTPAAPTPRAAAASVVGGPSGERLCGHRAISGRTCTREHGHEEKSHRYS